MRCRSLIFYLKVDQYTSTYLMFCELFAHVNLMEVTLCSLYQLFSVGRIWLTSTYMKSSRPYLMSSQHSCTTPLAQY